MKVFEYLNELEHERVIFCSNPEIGLKSIIAIHSTTLGPALGGVRMWPYRSEEEALLDVLRLSRGMTYKAATAGLNLGGGKAVIIGDPKKDKSEALFRAFGRFVDQLGGDYITAEDVGTDMEDMETILIETKWVCGVSPAHGGSGDPSPVTAYGVLQGMKAAVKLKMPDKELGDLSVAIQGLGSVGYHLAKYLRDLGSKIFGADIDPEANDIAAEELGVEIVSPDDIFDIECDIFSPCALGGVLNDDTIPRMKCKIVAGAANNQLADEKRHAEMIYKRGILYAPDFVINAGGLINVYNELIGEYNQERALRMTRGIYLNLLRIFQLAQENDMTPTEAASKAAIERIENIKKLGSRHWDKFIKR